MQRVCRKLSLGEGSEPRSARLVVLGVMARERRTYAEGRCGRSTRKGEPAGNAGHEAPKGRLEPVHRCRVGRAHVVSLPGSDLQANSMRRIRRPAGMRGGEVSQILNMCVWGTLVSPRSRAPRGGRLQKVRVRQAPRREATRSGARPRAGSRCECRARRSQACDRRRSCPC